MWENIIVTSKCEQNKISKFIMSDFIFRFCNPTLLRSIKNVALQRQAQIDPQLQNELNQDSSKDVKVEVVTDSEGEEPNELVNNVAIKTEPL